MMNYHDPYTGELMGEADSAFFKNHKVNTLVGMLIILMGHSYYT